VELEDLGFRYTNPEKIQGNRRANLAVRRESREAEIPADLNAITKLLKEAGVKSRDFRAPKHIYSDIQKMMEKGKSFDLVRECAGVRLIGPRHWRLLCRPWGYPYPLAGPFPMSLDDYIGRPQG